MFSVPVVRMCVCVHACLGRTLGVLRHQILPYSLENLSSNLELGWRPASPSESSDSLSSFPSTTVLE